MSESGRLARQRVADGIFRPIKKKSRSTRWKKMSDIEIERIRSQALQKRRLARKKTLINWWEKKSDLSWDLVKTSTKCQKKGKSEQIKISDATRFRRDLNNISLNTLFLHSKISDSTRSSLWIRHLRVPSLAGGGYGKYRIRRDFNDFSGFFHLATYPPG